MRHHPQRVDAGIRSARTMEFGRAAKQFRQSFLDFLLHAGADFLRLPPLVVCPIVGHDEPNLNRLTELLFQIAQTGRFHKVDKDESIPCRIEANPLPERGVAMKKSGISRRKMLKNVAGLGASAALGGGATFEGPELSGERKPNAVKRENERQGTLDWLLTNTRIDPKTKYRCPWIEGFCSRTSVSAGERIEFFVSTNPPSNFRLEIYRMGYYGGKGGRLMSELGPFRGAAQPEPTIGEKRVRECRWEACTGLVIPKD